MIMMMMMIMLIMIVMISTMIMMIMIMTMNIMMTYPSPEAKDPSQYGHQLLHRPNHLNRTDMIIDHSRKSKCCL